MMLRNNEAMIKKAITETLVEELFRALGFFILRFGQENTFNPIVQLQDFIAVCDGKFKMEKCDPEYLHPIDFVKTLPDFLIVHKDGNMNFLEVKYRYNSVLWPKDTDVFNTFPDTLMIVVNSTVDDKNPDFKFKDEDPKHIEELKNTRFHVYLKDEPVGENDFILQVLPLKRFLKEEFDIDDDFILKEFESLIPKWIIDPRK